MLLSQRLGENLEKQQEKNDQSLIRDPNKINNRTLGRNKRDQKTTGQHIQSVPRKKLVNQKSYIQQGDERNTFPSKQKWREVVANRPTL